MLFSSRPLIVLALACLVSSSRADELPRVEGVEAQPLVASARRVGEALEGLGEPLSAAVRARLDAALTLPDRRATVLAVQEALDPLCLIGVTINPESRVKATPGPAAKRLVQGGWRVFLVKVHNEAGVTAPLRVESPNAAPVFKKSSNGPEPKQSGRANEATSRRRKLHERAVWSQHRSHVCACRV